MMLRHRAASALVAGTLLALTLAGCDADSTPSAPSALPPASSATPSEGWAAPSDLAPSDVPSEEPQATGVGRVGNWPIMVPADGGAVPGADGPVIVDNDGVPQAYEVVSGDNMELISRRFGLEYGYLIAINQVRRDSLEVFVGDTLNLDATRITSLGDQNGQVYKNHSPYPIPPQH